MPNRLSGLLQSSFLRHVGTLTIGNVAAQAITIILSPLLSRLYGPKVFGMVALYVAIIALLSPLVTARYDYAILLVKSEQQVLRLVRIAGLITLLVSLLSLLVCLYLLVWHPVLLAHYQLNPWLLLLPVSLLLLGASQIVNACFNWHKSYRSMAKANVSQVGLNNSVALLLGACRYDPGLLLGQVMCRLPYLYFFIKLLRHSYQYVHHKRHAYRVLLRRYQNFPRYSVATGMLYNLSQQLPIIFLSYGYGAAEAGVFALGFRVLLLPAGVLANAIGQVYFKAIAVSQQQGDLAAVSRLTEKIFWQLLLIFILPMLVLHFYGPLLFQFVFGHRWYLAGVYASWLSGWLLLMAVTSPFANLLAVQGKQRIGLYFASSILVLRLMLLVLLLPLSAKAASVVFLYSLLSACLWAVYLLYLLHCARVCWWRTGLAVLVLLVVFYVSH